MRMRTVRLVKTTFYTDRNGNSRVSAVHLTTGKRARDWWDAAISELDNHAAIATRLLGRSPEFFSAIGGGGYIFGLDPSNDPEHQE